VADASVRRRGHGGDAICFAADKNRYIGAVSVGLSSDGKRLRRKSPVRPSRRSRTSSECWKGAQRRAPVFGGIHGPSGGGGLARAWVVGPVGADDPVVPGRRKAADGPAGIPAAAQAIRSGRPIGAGCAERAAVDAVAADRARLPGAGDPARRSRRSGGPERGSAGQAARGLAVDYRPAAGGSAGAVLGITSISTRGWSRCGARTGPAVDTKTPEVAAHATACADRRRRPPPAGRKPSSVQPKRAVMRRAGEDDRDRYPCCTGGMLAMSIAFSDRTESQ
jgi:hypothetical protein